MNSVGKALAGFAVLALFIAACSSSSTSSQGVLGASAAGGGGSAVTVKESSAGGKTVLVAGSNGMTLYTFANDSANSGKSNCSGGCLTTWPALTVPPGTMPTAASGVSGTLGTITRDDGTVQVTYNGLPLYFYKGDHNVGDTNGSYPSWNLVNP